MIRLLRELFAPYQRLIFVNANTIDVNKLQIIVGDRYRVIPVEPSVGVPHISSHVAVI
jgi:hypothetical protein